MHKLLWSAVRIQFISFLQSQSFNFFFCKLITSNGCAPCRRLHLFFAGCPASSCVPRQRVHHQGEVQQQLPVNIPKVLLLVLGHNSLKKKKDKNSPRDCGDFWMLWDSSTPLEKCLSTFSQGLLGEIYLFTPELFAILHLAVVFLSCRTQFAGAVSVFRVLLVMP